MPRHLRIYGKGLLYHVIARGRVTGFLSGSASGASSLDSLIRPEQYRLRDCEVECFRRLQINDELKFRRLLYRQVSRLCTFENLGKVSSCASPLISIAG